MPEKNETNKVRLIGEAVSEFTFNHEVFGEKFYFVSLSVTRLSGQVDVIPISISERLMDISKDYRGTTMEVLGQFRSYNRHDGEKKPFDTVRVRAGSSTPGRACWIHWNESDLPGWIHL